MQHILLYTTVYLTRKHNTDWKNFSIIPVQEQIQHLLLYLLMLGYLFFKIRFDFKFISSSSGIYISLYLYPRIFFVHTYSSQMKEMIHTLPPACEPTACLDLFLSKVNGVFVSRFRRTYMAQCVFDDHIPGKIISACRNRVPKPNGWTVLHAHKVAL